jgi:hypothetical protein
MSFEKSEWRQYFFPPLSLSLWFCFDGICAVLCLTEHYRLLKTPFLFFDTARCCRMQTPFQSITHSKPLTMHCHIYTSASSSGRRPPRQHTKEECIWLDIEIYFTCLMQTNRTQTRCVDDIVDPKRSINNRGKISKFSSTTGGSDLTAFRGALFPFFPLLNHRCGNFTWTERLLMNSKCL